MVKLRVVAGENPPGSRSSRIPFHLQEVRMSRTSIIRLALVLLAVTLLIAACGPEKGSPITCPTEDLQAPYGVSPDHIVVADLQPVFFWEYPEECSPEGYRVEVTDYGTYDDSDTISGGPGTSSTTWSPSEPLLPATDYEWRVAAMNGDTLGPYSMSTRFWTGPLCDASTMPAPTLAQPADGSTVDNSHPPLVWTHAEGCLPEYYSVDLSADPGFGGPSLVADFHSPAKAVIPAEELADCTTYYWRVVAHRGGGTPPMSSTWTFNTNFTGSCPGDGSSSISGVVWQRDASKATTPTGSVRRASLAWRAFGLTSAPELAPPQAWRPR
jgi:hypothetical protein